ncbi:hypothetical protein N7501_000017 [Penicillium viridicatum]|nr:hypothetical protein N7501_000017 [Penicillium viridicatum]
MTFDAFSPHEVIEAISKSGAHKGNMRLDKVLFSAVSAGCLLAFACGTTLSTTAAPWFQDNAPGLIRTIGALVFPYVAVLHRRLPWSKMLIHWAVTFIGNFAGSLFVVAIIFGCMGILPYLL